MVSSIGLDQVCKYLRLVKEQIAFQFLGWSLWYPQKVYCSFSKQGKECKQQPWVRCSDMLSVHIMLLMDLKSPGISLFCGKQTSN